MKNLFCLSLAICLAGCAPQRAAVKATKVEALAVVGEDVSPEHSRILPNQESSEGRAEPSVLPRWQSFVDSIQKRLDENQNYQLEQINTYATVLKEEEGIDFSCGGLNPQEGPECFKNLTSLIEAYRQKLIFKNPNIGQIQRVEIWRLKTDTITNGENGVSIRASLGKTSEMWAELLNGYMNGASRRLLEQRVKRMTEEQKSVQEQLGKPVLFGQVLEGIYGFREYQNISAQEMDAGILLVRRALELYKITDAFKQQPQLLLHAAVDSVEINRHSLGIFENNGERVLGIGLDQSAEDLLQTFLRLPSRTANYYSAAVHAILRKPYGPARYQQLKNQDLDFQLRRQQVDQQLSRLSEAFPEISINCSLETTKGKPNISLEQCQKALVLLEESLAHRAMINPLFESIVIEDKYMSNSLVDGVLYLHYGNSVQRTKEILKMRTKEFESMVEELTPQDPATYPN